ncbi:MAG: DUF2142 domain-containing protein [Microcoleus vaginatus WJT46-NPBG5]|jgi:uncharacterized membrane protein|nr:DUF2142 domain-containing protein [Microcoleus vaginatus WJT46-NPBG5]
MRQNWKSIVTTPEKAFVIISLISGILFLLITPPFQAADEYQHFYRSFQVAQGSFISEKKIADCHGRLLYTPAAICVGGMLPKSVLTTAQQASSVDLRFQPKNKQNVQDILSLLNLPLKRQDRIFVRFPNAALYSPIPYLPQALGMAFGQLLGGSPIIIFYLGRAVNLFVWVGLIYLAIKITPIYKWLLFLLALTPMQLFQAASLSADAFTNAASFLLAAIFFQMAFEPAQHIKFIKIISIASLSILIGLSKTAYFPLNLLYLLIPIKKLGSVTKYFLGFFGINLLTLIALLTWSSLIKDLYIPLRPATDNVVLSEQVNYILNQPMQFILTQINTFSTYGLNYLEQLIGKLGWLDTSLPKFHIISYIILLVTVALVSHKSDIKISLFQKTIALIIILLTGLLITTAMYLAWTPVGAGLIEGVQGRYFIPLTPLFFLLLYNQKIKINLKIPISTLTGYALFSCTLTAAILLKRYYL